MLFIPDDNAVEAKCVEIFNAVAKAEGFDVLAWRDVPIDTSAVGEIARKTMPRFKQVFIRSKQVGGRARRRAGGRGPVRGRTAAVAPRRAGALGVMEQGGGRATRRRRLAAWTAAE